MYAAIVEFDALSDPVRSAAQHDDLFLVADLGLAFFIVGRVEIGSLGGKFCGAAVDALIDGAKMQRTAFFTHCLLCGVEERRQPAVSKALLLELVERSPVKVSERLSGEPGLDLC